MSLGGLVPKGDFGGSGVGLLPWHTPGLRARRRICHGRCSLAAVGETSAWRQGRTSWGEADPTTTRGKEDLDQNPSIVDSMARLWLHLCICFQIPGFCTNLLLSQTPGHILAQTNNKTEIRCELKKEHTGVYWYRWSQERQNFEFLVFSNPLGKTTYGANINQDKFSVQGGSSHSSYSLRISQLRASDNGTYYCSVSQSFQLLLGSGTHLGVVDVLPLPPKTTEAPRSTKPVRSVTKSKAVSKKGACSPLVWVPLATSVLVLLLSLVPTAYHLYRLRRRLWLRIRRQ
ncbi:T-cell surface glycoprotein CD8 beta chain [Patagioenas fasciata]|uniref:T-cell surface glycoprotein CD8 beta chain n=1 Tax=Patagioenas fasciata TaxID=372321 RepID=UPI0032E8612C